MKILIINAGYFFKESLSSLFKSPLLNLVSIVSIGLSLLLLALVFAGWWASEEIVTQIQKDAEMAVFYHQDLTDEEVSNLQERLLMEEGVDEVTHVDEDEAYSRMEAMLGEGAEVLRALEENPFAPFFSVSALPRIIPALAEEISTLEGVDYVRDNEEIISQFQAISDTIRYVGIVLMVVVGITTMIITSHIIRLGILSKEEHINLLRLLGAGRGFVYLPFVLEGLWLGGLGGLFALSLLIFVLPYGLSLVAGVMPFMPAVPLEEVLLPLGGTVFALGVVFALFGSLLALRFAGRERV